jgi:phosphoserine phosphatase
VFQISLSPAQLVSSAYLQQLLGHSQLRFLLLEDGLLLSNLAMENSALCDSTFPDVNDQHSELLVYTQGLNLQKLSHIQQALKGLLTLSACRPILFPGTDDDYAVAIEVNSVVSDELTRLLENLSQHYQLELAYLGDRPTLDQPGLLLMDMDSTVIDIECIDEIAKLTGVGKQVSEVTELAMQGKLDFVESLNSRVACLVGCEQVLLSQIRDALPLNPGLLKLIKVLKHYDWKVAIASGGFTYFADYLLNRLDLDAAVSNTLEIVDGKLTGKVVGEIVDAKVKARTLSELANAWGISSQQTVAMGDGANDLLMMNAAALGVAYHAKPLVRQQASAAIRHGGLDNLLWMLKRD